MYVALLKNSVFCLQISHRSIWKELSLFSRHNFFSSTEYSKSSGSSIHRKNVRSTRTYVKKVGMRSLKHTRAHTHSLPRHYDNDVIHVRKHNRTHAQRATRLWVELVLLPEFNGAAMLKSLQIGGVNPP